MKTNNNISKNTGFISFILMIFFLTLNLTAQQSFDKNSLIELKRSIYFSDKNDVAVNISTIDYVPDIAIAVEDWMHNPLSWSSEVSTERWMNDPSSWSTLTVMEILPALFIEEKTVFESWMIQPDWNVAEKELEIEKWMTSPKEWN